MVRRRRAPSWLPAGLALLLAAGSGCTSPTVNLATEKPIEIRIDLRHEVRVHLDREVSDMLGSEQVRESVTARGFDASVERRVRAAKERGVIGEQADGYLGVCAVSASERERALVERVNAERRAEYGVLAEDYRAPIEEIAKLAGASRIRAAGPAELVRTPDGRWIEASEAQVVVIEERPDA